ncbi:unnamed protein product [Spirodela intermedia]|uniref:Gnk2-homologous domain-containing protein n=1 Tax=Spirodela intermedia TaxID=51605 RepID=A0A7I8J640_SPIIN|nr:unnamed protein product [Spirodela intermedia]CAA6664863.1 unnamed protein product [Spirodela intermedia]
MVPRRRAPRRILQQLECHSRGLRDHSPLAGYPPIQGSLGGFYTTSAGRVKNRAYGLAQCRQDVSVPGCRACLKDAAVQLPERCPAEAEAWMWFDHCLVHYGTRPFRGELDISYGVVDSNETNVTENAVEQQRFNRDLRSLMGKVRAQAAARRNLGLGRGQTKFSPNVTIYALAQCTRDLPPLACSNCISSASGDFPEFCLHKKACRALYSGCYVRYELYPFFFPLAVGSSRASEPSVSVVISP